MKCRFATDVHALVAGRPVNWLVVDAGAITGIYHSAAVILRDLLHDLNGRGVPMVLVHFESPLPSDLQRHSLSEIIGNNHIFDTLHEALAAIEGERFRAVGA